MREYQRYSSQTWNCWESCKTVTTEWTLRADLLCYKTRKHENPCASLLYSSGKESIKLDWQRLYRISSFGQFFPFNIVEFNEKQTVASPCKKLEGRLIESGKTSSSYISEPLHCVLLFLCLRTSPYAFNLTIYITIVDIGFVPVGRKKTHINWCSLCESDRRSVRCYNNKTPKLFYQFEFFLH